MKYTISECNKKEVKFMKNIISKVENGIEFFFKDIPDDLFYPFFYLVNINHKVCLNEFDNGIKPKP